MPGLLLHGAVGALGIRAVRGVRRVGVGGRQAVKFDLRVGDRVRLRYGEHAGEVGEVADVSWHGNRFGSYARVRVKFAGGQAIETGMDSLEGAEAGDEDERRRPD
jgi:hypothetical protein